MTGENNHFTWFTKEHYNWHHSATHSRGHTPKHFGSNSPISTEKNGDNSQRDIARQCGSHNTISTKEDGAIERNQWTQCMQTMQSVLKWEIHIQKSRRYVSCRQTGNNQPIAKVVESIPGIVAQAKPFMEFATTLKSSTVEDVIKQTPKLPVEIKIHAKTIPSKGAVLNGDFISIIDRQTLKVLLNGKKFRKTSWYLQQPWTLCYRP